MNLQKAYSNPMPGPAMMASSARAYNVANVMLTRSESTPADTFVAMLASPRSVGGLEDVVMGGGQKRPYYRIFETSEDSGDEDAADDCSHHVEKKRRMTVDQLRSLEKNFELDNKLEPERKMQLAQELGLQPRQVAVWFQNRRARWKTKQLERDYDVLKSAYDALKSDYDSIVEDKENLQAEIRQLKVKLQTQSNQTKFDGQVFKADGLDGGSKSSESNSSEIMNADSPHPIDSGLSPGVDQKAAFVSTQLSSPTTAQATDNLDASLVQFAQDVCGGKLVALAPQPFQRVAVKVEDEVLSSTLLQEECSNYFYSIDESGSLPWWETGNGLDCELSSLI